MRGMNVEAPDANGLDMIGMDMNGMDMNGPDINGKGRDGLIGWQGPRRGPWVVGAEGLAAKSPRRSPVVGMVHAAAGRSKR
jgi:hypothetical protein